MSTNAPTSRRIMYMYCHVDEVSLEVNFFFFKKIFNRKFPILKKIFLYHFLPNFTSFSFLLYTLNPLPIYQPFIYIYIYIYIYKWDNSWENRLELSEIFCLSLDVFRPNLRNLTWIILENFSIFGWSSTKF